MSIMSISPLDGRYSEKLTELNSIVSEYGLIKYRIIIEIEWLKHISSIEQLNLTRLSKDEIDSLASIINSFDSKEAEYIKHIEKTTKHDVKAVEYYLQSKFSGSLAKYISMIHFACTSEDINNIAYALMIKSIKNIVSDKLKLVLSQFSDMSKLYADSSMISRTHGQVASPTTMGKEIAVYLHRLSLQLKELQNQSTLAKINGAVGNYNAHYAAYNDINWQLIAKSFIESLELQFNSHTTQIESHDYQACIYHNCIRINSILINFVRDIWSYISINYFQLKVNKDEIGSSTMPHKVNPIDFENAEGNLGIANALFAHFAEKLTVSRLQRDLSDSTVQRSLGSAFGYMLLAIENILLGISKLSINKSALSKDLNENPSVISEAIQTVMRKYGINDSYEQMKAITRGQNITIELLREFITTLPISNYDKDYLLNLTPESYIGIAAELANQLL